MRRTALLAASVLAALGAVPAAEAGPLAGSLSWLQTEGRGAKVIPVLRTENKRYELEGLRRGAVGSRIQVFGRVRGDRVLVSRSRQIASPPPRSNSSGVMIVGASWPNYELNSPLQTEKFEYLSEWSEKASWGKWKWDPVTALSIEFSKPLACTYEDQFVAPIRQELRSRGYPLFSRYRALAVIVPEAVFDKCGAAPGAGGYAYLDSWLSPYDVAGGLSVYNDNYPSSQWKGLLIHELGHTLGANHAHKIHCSNGSLAYEEVIEEYDEYYDGWQGACKQEEYGDPWDAMGAFRKEVSALSQPRYGPASALEIGWIDRISSVPLDGNTYQRTLDSYEVSPALLRMRLPGRSGFLRGRSPGWVIADYRDERDLGAILFEDYRPGSYDWRWPFGDPEPQIVSLRFQPSPAMEYAFDLPEYGRVYNFPVSTPREIEDDWQCEYWNPCRAWDRRFGLRPGQSWSDPFNLLRISFQSVAPSGQAELEIETPVFREPQLPQMRWLQKPPRKTSKRQALFRFRVQGALSVRCALNKKKPRPCSDQFFVQKLSPGRQRLVVTARNELGSRQLTYRWRVKK